MTSFSGTEREANRTPEVGPPESRRARLGPTDAVVAITVLTMAVWWFRITDGSWFYVDEWLMAFRGDSPRDFVEPYNGHLSITFIAIYRAHFGLFGFSHYWLLRLIGVSALAAVPAVLYLTTRRRVPQVVAGLCAVLLVLSTAPGLEPGGMNHNIAIAFGLVAAWAMMRDGRRFDLIVAVALLLSIATAGDALPFALALLVLCAARRVPLHRWLATAGPVGLWVLWRVTFGATESAVADFQMSLVDKLLLAPRSLPETLRGLAAGSSVAALTLAVVLVAGLAYKLWTEGRVGLGSIVAWIGAWEGWWFGLATSRGILTSPAIFRYRFAASVFLMLAVLPTGVSRDGDAAAGRRVRWPTPMRQQWLGAGALVLVAIVLMVTNRVTTRHSGEMLAAYGKSVEAQFTVMTAIPTVVPLDHRHPFVMGSLTQEQLLEATRGYGPKPLSPEQLDVRLLGEGSVIVSDVEATTNEDCDPTTYRIHASLHRIWFRTADEPAWVSARLFGDQDVRLVEIPPASAVLIRPSTDVFGHQWVLTTGPVCVGP